MSRKIDYTSGAQRFAARFPLVAYVGIQVNFWVVANILLAIILHFHILSLSQVASLDSFNGLKISVVIAMIFGVLYGICLGVADYYLDKKIFRKKTLGKVILLKTGISLCVLVILLIFIRFVLLDWIIAGSNNSAAYALSDRSWGYMFYLLVVYYFFMTLVINFINQVNKKYGPGVLVPLLLGKYRNPREEERIFMFMDLKSSTEMAEKLGHLKYSSFIRDCFMDINQVLWPFNAQVYQYVGDEIVLTWTVSDGLKSCSCVSFFFACEWQFFGRRQYYSEQYGSLPDFKAGLHMGMVTAVEIGEVKRDIAYHGDTLNTAARIQSVCNAYNKKLLVSDSLLDKIALDGRFNTEPLGMIQLKGKSISVGITSVDWIENNLPV